MRLFLYLALALALPPLGARAQGELPRAGAPRPLRLLASDGAPLAGLPRDVAWERSGIGVFFTLERDGTRNVWRAAPDPQDASRFPAWRALPVTNLSAPRFAAQPCPLPDGEALICVSNALAKAPAAGAVSQIVRYEPEKAEFRALSDAITFYDSPQISPDGKRVAFSGGRGAGGSVYQAATENPRKHAVPPVTPLVARARRPVWLDDETLLVEGLDSRARGLYWMRARPDFAPNSTGDADGVAASNVIVGGGGEANVLGANGIVFCAKTSAQSPTSLYFIARDGSGLRALAATKNARHPAVAPDGQTLAYDAPYANGQTLWVVPLLRVENRVAARANSARQSRERAIPTRANSARANPALSLFCAGAAPEYDGPSASLSAVRATPSGAVSIIGSWRGATDSSVTLEVGQGGKPKVWQNLNVISLADAPLADAQGNRVLAIWNPPARARGDWTLRLSLRGLGGGAQSLLRVRLPLAVAAPAPLPPPVASPGDAATEGAAPPPSDAATSPLPRATPLPALPDIAPVRGPFLSLPPLASPVPTGEDDDLPGFPTMQAPANSAPIPIAPPADAPPPNNSNTAGIEIVPVNPSRLQSLPTVPLAESPIAREDESGYGERPDAPAGAPWAAQFDVAGTPARMAPREKIKVNLRAINRGATTWQTGGNGADRVRIVARWVDFSTGTRRQWNFFWLGEPVAPGARTARAFDLAAPARAGKYKLIYGLVHLPADGEYKPPPYGAPQENWDDEFGAIAFAVEVAPN